MLYRKELKRTVGSLGEVDAVGAEGRSRRARAGSISPEWAHAIGIATAKDDLAFLGLEVEGRELSGLVAFHGPVFADQDHPTARQRDEVLRTLEAADGAGRSFWITTEDGVEGIRRVRAAEGAERRREEAQVE